MRANSILIAAAIALCGCQHITAKVPGVLDLRSDAAETPANPKAPTGARDGLDAFMKGDGVQGKDGVTIADRQYWVIGLLPLRGDGPNEAMTAAIGDGGVLKKVTIGEQYTLADFGISLCGTLICPPVTGWVLHPVWAPYDFKVTGIRSKATTGEPPPPAPTADGKAGE